MSWSQERLEIRHNLLLLLLLLHLIPEHHFFCLRKSALYIICCTEHNSSTLQYSAKCFDGFQFDKFCGNNFRRCRKCHAKWNIQIFLCATFLRLEVENFVPQKFVAIRYVCTCTWSNGMEWKAMMRRIKLSGYSTLITYEKYCRNTQKSINCSSQHKDCI